MKLKYGIKYEELKQFLFNLSYEDFHNKVLIKSAETMDDIYFFKIDIKKIPIDRIVDYGVPFLVDILGNDLSVVFLSKRKYKAPNGRSIRAKFDKTVVNDCREIYGTPINGYWIIPPQFLYRIY